MSEIYPDRIDRMLQEQSSENGPVPHIEERVLPEKERGTTNPVPRRCYPGPTRFIVTAPC